MDQARQISLLLRLYRHHEAAVPLGDDVVLQDLGVAGGGNDLLQDLTALGQSCPHVAADVRQFRAGGISHRVLVGNAPPDLVLQKAIAVDRQEDLVQGGGLHVVRVEIFLCPAGGVKEIPYTDQFRNAEAAAPVRPVQQFPHRLHAGESGGAVEGHHGPCAVGLV